MAAGWGTAALDDALDNFPVSLIARFDGYARCESTTGNDVAHDVRYADESGPGFSCRAILCARDGRGLLGWFGVILLCPWRYNLQTGRMYAFGNSFRGPAKCSNAAFLVAGRRHRSMGR